MDKHDHVVGYDGEVMALGSGQLQLVVDVLFHIPVPVEVVFAERGNDHDAGSVGDVEGLVARDFENGPRSFGARGVIGRQADIAAAAGRFTAGLEHELNQRGRR